MSKETDTGRGRRRSDDNETRQAFIMAGLSLFGEYGLDGVSTRRLARAAGANIAGITYHFGSKENLYHAVVGYIVEKFNSHTQAARAEAWRKLGGPLDKPAILEVLRHYLDPVVTVLIEKVRAMRAEKIILREQNSPTAAFDIVYEGYIKDNILLLSRIISLYTGGDEESAETVIRAHSLIGQILVFLAAPESLLRSLKVKNLREEHSEIVRRIIMTNIEASLNAWAGEEGGQ